MQERIRAVELMGKSLGIFEKTDFQMHEPLSWADWFNENWIKLAMNHKMCVLWINFLINELKNKKPESSKGIYLKKIFINTTMGPGLQVDPSSAM